IKKIAQLCGFTDIHYFTRMFKRFTSLTPKNYREQGISDKLWDKPYFIRQS
ncbi:MAG: helix-turn-helix transcriptional regulator, partial [Hungatella sp.]|nr:helix-turn-helix transcriptional regulator [Hungatella sp.]